MGRPLQELYQLYEAEDLDGANQALGRFADLYATGQIPQYHQVVDTIIAWGAQILAYHTSRRATNGPLEGINNLHQVLRRVAHGFTNYDNYAARGNPRNMSPTPSASTAKTHDFGAASTTSRPHTRRRVSHNRVDDVAEVAEC